MSKLPIWALCTLLVAILIVLFVVNTWFVVKWTRPTQCPLQVQPAKNP